MEAKLFVTENLNLNSEEALKYDVIEYVNLSLEDLLQKVDDLTIATVNGEFTIHTTNSKIRLN